MGKGTSVQDPGTTNDSRRVDLRIDQPERTLDWARAAQVELRDLARTADERRDSAVRVLTAIEQARAGQVPTPYPAALELDGLRDDLLDLLGRIHATTDPYTAWAVSEPLTDAPVAEETATGVSEPVPVPVVDLNSPAPAVVPTDAA